MIFLFLLSLPLLALTSWFVFRLYLSREARYARRLRRRQELQIAADRVRQRRMLEVRMREVHERGLRWSEDYPQAESFEGRWRRPDRG